MMVNTVGCAAARGVPSATTNKAAPSSTSKIAATIPSRANDRVLRGRIVEASGPSHGAASAASTSGPETFQNRTPPPPSSQAVHPRGLTMMMEHQTPGHLAT